MHPRILIPLMLASAAVVIPARSRAQAGAPPVVVEIQRLYLGSGEPGQPGFENATLVVNDVYHVPQYLPGRPTAASIWPRVIDVPCTRLASGGLRCQGYAWRPGIGRAEYLYFRPVVVASTPVGAERDEAPVAGEGDASPPGAPASMGGAAAATPPADPEPD